MNAMRDCVVVGTGVVGLATALELLDRGRTVCVVGPRDGRHDGQATRAAGAMLTVFSEVESHHDERRMALDVPDRVTARAGYADWLARVAEPSGARIPLIKGIWVLATPRGPADGAELEAIATAARRWGRGGERHDPADVPGLDPDPYVAAYAALWLPDEAVVDTAALAAALAVAVAAHSRASWLPHEALSLEDTADGVTVRTGDGGTATAEQAVLAGGAGIPALLAASPVDDPGLPPILAGRGVSLLVETPVSFAAAVRTPARGYTSGGHAVPRGGGTVYLGSTNRIVLGAAAAMPPNLGEIGTLIEDAALELNTRLRGASFLGARVGHRPYTVDHRPLVGRTQHDRILAATATYRCGILLAPRIAELIADEIDAPGTHRDHPYAPGRPMSVPGTDELLELGVPALVEMLIRQARERTGPAAKPLGALLAAGLRQVLGDGAETVRGLWREAPVAECLPLLYEATAELGRTNGGRGQR